MKPKTNAEIRQWYLKRISSIPKLNERWRKEGRSAQEKAKAAWRIRHRARMKARSMMADQTELAQLRDRDLRKYGNADGPTFEFLVERLTKAGLDETEVYDSIITQSYRTDAELNKRLGL